MSTKREWLEMILSDIESLIEWSKSDPDTFNRLVSKQELKRLEEMASNIAAERILLTALRATRHDDRAAL